MKAELAEALKSGDEERVYVLALELAHGYWGSMRWQNTSCMERDAAEVRFLEMVRKALAGGKLDPARNPFGYLTTCARNALLMELRTKMRRTAREEAYMEEEVARRRRGALPVQELLVGGYAQGRQAPDGFVVPVKLMMRADISPGAKLLYALVRQLTGRVTTEEIAKQLGTSRCSVTRWRQELRAQGLIRTRQQGPTEGFLYVVS